MSYLLDTNIISNIVKKNEIVKAKFWELKFREEKFFISVISYYEVKRGLLYASATRQISNFNGFCQEVTVLFYCFTCCYYCAGGINCSAQPRLRSIRPCL